jgi:ribosomal protein L16/L10AE
MLIKRFKKHKKYKINQKIKKTFKFIDLKFGAYGLKTQNACLLTNKHLEAVRRVFTKNTQKTCSI